MRVESLIEWQREPKQREVEREISWVKRSKNVERKKFKYTQKWKCVGAVCHFYRALAFAWTWIIIIIINRAGRSSYYQMVARLFFKKSSTVVVYEIDWQKFVTTETVIFFEWEKWSRLIILEWEWKWRQKELAHECVQRTHDFEMLKYKINDE